MGPCTHCASAKTKIKPVAILTSLPVTHLGHILAIDISHMKYPSIGDKQYWLRVVELFTNMKWSYFISKKYDTSGKVIGLIWHLKATKNVTVKIIRCDNAGENKSLQKDSIKKGIGLTFQFPAPYTPQHSGSIEQSFATSYRRMRAILNSNKIKGNFRQSLWAETANFENDTKNIMVNCDDEACPYKRFYGKMMSYSNHIQAFRQIGIAKNRNKISGKLKTKEKFAWCLATQQITQPGRFSSITSWQGNFCIQLTCVG